MNLGLTFVVGELYSTFSALADFLYFLLAFFSVIAGRVRKLLFVIEACIVEAVNGARFLIK